MRRNPSNLVEKKYDVIVIGAGIYGACIAWDASQRGLSVALVERGDFGQETSANSLKTVHGGLRYLQDFDLKLVRMMIEERSRYLQIAPHLVQPLACITPTYRQITTNKVVMGIALMLNDFAGFDRNKSLEDERAIPSSQLYSESECLRVLPGLPREGVTGAASWYDAQIYDTERFTLACVISAEEAGAEVSNYVEATGFLIQGNRVEGIIARDRLTNETFKIHSRFVVNSAGPWIDKVLDNLTVKYSEKIFKHSLAVNIITPKIIEDYAVGVPSWPGENNGGITDKKASHMLFVSPWRGKSIVGTFHTHFHGDLDTFSVQQIDLQEIINEANSAYPGAALTQDDIHFVHYGFLPENSKLAQPDVKLIRKSRIIDHGKEQGVSGLLSVMGVKYTTARRTAEKTVNVIIEKLGLQNSPDHKKEFHLHGGKLDHFSKYLSYKIEEDSDTLAHETIDHWVRSYGSEYPKVKQLLTGPVGSMPLSLHDEQVIKAQVIYAVRDEMAVKLSDVLLRRTGIGTLGQPDDSILQVCAEEMAAELGWSKEVANREIEELKEYYKRHGARISEKD